MMKPVRLAATVLLGSLAAISANADAQQQSTERTERRQARFHQMDTNRDGIITREEWRGGDEAFTRRDANRDGVLSGSEVWTSAAGDWQSRAGRDNVLTQTFRRADVNRDGILSRDEWASGAQSFNRVDANQDGVVTEPEFLGEGWKESAATDAPGKLDEALVESFRRADTNRDGILSRNEWASGAASFDRVDANADGVVTQPEFMGEGWQEETDAVGTSGERTTLRRDTRAYQSGYDRGLIDGRQAGKEDRELRNQWDLEGQRELEQADAGYSSAVGPREEYQAGYRAGFRAGYKQGFGRRQEK
jgi:Ca2+-binding EF-hand superfamily protein